MKRSERSKVKTEGEGKHPDPHNDERDNHERHISGSVNVRGEIEAKRPPDLKDEHDTERKQDNAREKKKIVVEISTLVVVAIYAFLTWWQGCSTKRAADAATSAADTASRALTLDQRPWLYAERFTLAKEPALNEPIDISSWMSNSGKTPGLNVMTAQRLLWRNYEPSFAEAELDPLIQRAAPKGLITPGLRQDKITSSTVATNVMTRPDEINFYNAGATKLYLFSEIAYCDSLGNRYWTKQCVWHSRTQGLEEVGFCGEGNTAGRDATYKDCPPQ
jgi:hypothetical protein